MKVYNNKTRIGFVFCIIFIIFSILIIGNVEMDKVSATTLTNQEIDNINKEMTASLYFDVNGVQQSLLDYPNYLHNRFQLDNKNYGVKNVKDEWIEKLVPIELFDKKANDYFYIGDKYGFYFDYNETDDTYLIYFIEQKSYYKSGNLERTIKPIYYENYVYNEQPGIVSLEYTQYDEPCTSCKPCYFPSQHNIPRYHYKKYSSYNKLYLKDVNFTANLYNENHLNVGEYGYDANVDNGGYFIGNQYYFNGVSTQSGKGEFLIETLKIGLGYIPLGTSGLTVGDAMSIGTFISEYVNFIDAAKNDFRSTISNEDDQKLINIKDTLYAEDQIEAGGLFKSTGTQFVTRNDKEAVLYGINNANYVTNKYQIMNKNQSTAWNSRFSGKIKLDIVREVPTISGSIVENIASVESNDWHYSIDNGYSTEIELYEDNNQLYILNDAKHKVKFTAPENGFYTINTFGNIKNSINHSSAVEIDEYNQKVIVDLNKGQDFFVDINKYDFEGSANVGISVSFTPEEIEKGQTKTLIVAPGEKEYLIYYSDAISFNYSCQNANEEIKIEFSKTVYYNDIYNHTGQLISGSILHSTGKFYISIINYGNSTQFIDIKFSDTEEIDIDSTNSLTVDYQNAYSLKIPYTIDVTLTAEYDNNMLIEIYNNLGETIARTTVSSINSLNFKILANQQYYILIKHLTNAFSIIDVSFEKHIYNLSPINNNFMKLYKDETLLYYNNSYSGDYEVKSDIEFKIFDSEYNMINDNEDGSFTLRKNNNYYFYIEETKNECHINFNLKHTTELSGTFFESEVKFIKYIPTITGKYNISGIDNYFWYDENMGIRYGELLANETYYLMIEGIMNTDYNISITHQEIVRTQIPLQVGVQRSTGKYYFIVLQSGNYIFKTYREIGVVSSTVSVYGEDGTKYFSDICTDITSRTQYLMAGTYYLDLETTPITETVSIRITKSR